MTRILSRIDGTEFKEAERALRAVLTPGLPAIIRLDGRAFHSYCRGLDRPFDRPFMADMDQVALGLAQQIDGVRLVYVQSDEISLLITDRLVDDIDSTDPRAPVQGFMFGGQVQKLVSIAAAIASSLMNAARFGTVTDRLAVFDARAFALPDMNAVERYFQWRQADARVNALGMAASARFSHRELMGVSNADRADMLRSVGADPDDLPLEFTEGRVVVRGPSASSTTFSDRRTGGERTVEFTRMVPFTSAAPDFDEGLGAAWY